MFRPPFRLELVVAQMAFIGVGSVFIVGATGLAYTRGETLLEFKRF